MSDPISPIGSPGQSPVAASVPVNSSPVSANDIGGQTGYVSESVRIIPASTAQASVLVDIRSQEAASLQKSDTKEAAPSLEESVKAFREFLKNLPSDLQFKSDQESGIVIFKIVNPVTKEVIRQFPADEIVVMARKLKVLEAQNQSKSGIFLDQRT